MIHVAGNDWSVLVPAADATWTPTQRVSVCIPAHNPSNIRRVLDALALQTYPTSLMEVVVADDGSEPAVEPVGEYPFPVSVVRLERTLAFGAGRARNAAARAATGELLVFLDADIVPERQAVAAYARWFVDRPDVFAMGLCRFADMDDLTDDEFRRLVRDGGLGAHFAGREVDDQEWRENTFRRTDDLRVDAVDAFRITIGATFAVAADQYWAVGGFRELGIRGIEDTEFGYRMHADGAVMVLDRDALHWHQGRRNMNLDRKEQIRIEREPYVERLLPVRGFRKDPPDPSDRPVHTVPRAVVHVAGGPGRLRSVRELVDSDHLVLGLDQVADAPDGMPFLAAFSEIWLPSTVSISDRSIRLLVRELGRRDVGSVQVHGPDGEDVLAVRTRALRRVRREFGGDPGVRPSPEQILQIADSFGAWHVAAKEVEMSWDATGTDVDDVGADDADEAPSAGARSSASVLRASRRSIRNASRRLVSWIADLGGSVERGIEAVLKRLAR